MDEVKIPSCSNSALVDFINFVEDQIFRSYFGQYDDIKLPFEITRPLVHVAKIAK